MRDYTRNLDAGIKGMTIGIVKEGFGHPQSEKEVDSAVKAAAKKLEKARRAKTSQAVSIPMHLDAMHIWNAIAIEGATEQMMKGNGYGINWEGTTTRRRWMLMARLAGPARRPVRDREVRHAARRVHEPQLPPRYYAKAANWARRMQRLYDEALAGFDCLLMPTTNIVAPPLPAPDAGVLERFAASVATGRNTAVFDVTHHPALSLPCGHVDGLPVGMMLVGRHLDEATLYRIAHAFEQSCDWRERS